MLLNAEELLALANGDADPDRLADLLGRLERCPASMEALQVLVTLKANRKEALKVLRLANEADESDPVTYVEKLAASKMQGLHLAASVALAALVIVLAIVFGQQVADWLFSLLGY